MSMGWNHIILEGFCARKWDYQKKCDPNMYGWEGNEDPEKRGTFPNPDYDPDAKVPERPEFCEKRICYTCYEKECPHLATGKGRWKDLEWVIKQRKKRKKGKKK
jgi:hypothetical protein